MKNEIKKDLKNEYIKYSIIKSLIEKYPNDSDLGREIRKIIIKNEK